MAENLKSDTIIPDITSGTIGVAVMASGSGSRFRSNKLLADAGGRSVIERTLSLIDKGLFDPDNVCVVTRFREVAGIAERYGYQYILHELPYKSDTVRLAVEAMPDAHGILFLQGDQFLVERDSLKRLVKEFIRNPERPARLCFSGRRGSPVVFPPSFYPPLTEIRGDNGGSALLKDAEVSCVEADHEYELWDADTPEDLERMISVYDLR